MKTQWMAVAVLSAAVAAGCGEKAAENSENSPQSDATTVAVPEESGTQANLQAAPAEQPAVSSNRDAIGTTSRPRTSQPARESRPAAIPAEAPRLSAAPAPRPAPVVRF